MDRDKQQRIPTDPPEEFENDEAAREFGRQIAMDSLLGEIYASEAGSDGKGLIAFRAWPRLAAAAAAVLIGLMVWKFFPGDSTSLAAGWRVEPVGDVEFSIEGPRRVRLKRGELLVYSDTATPQETITIETPNARATASGTRFYVGAHQEVDSASTPEPPYTIMNKLTRILVLSGVVSLATEGGNTSAQANQILVAKGGEKPKNLAVQANSDFAIDLYRELSKDGESNLFFSPFSVTSALAMAAEGARGDTALEMGKVLRFPDAARRMGGDDAQRIPWEIKKIHSGMAELNALLNRQDDDTPEIKAIRAKIRDLRQRHTVLKVQIKAASLGDDFDREFELGKQEQKIVAELNKLLPQVDQYELQVANALWAERSFPLRDDYTKAIADSYGSGAAFPADFRNDHEGARKQINAWVAKRTSNRIEELLAPGDIKPLTSLVITNAIYFRGDWKSPFDENNTKPLDFFTAPGESEKVATMGERWFSGGRYGAFEADGSLFNTPVSYPENKVPKQYPGEDGFAMFEMPYKGDDLSMVVLAPNRIDGLAAIEKSLSAEKLDGWIAKLKARNAHVYLPKFEAQTNYRLAEQLKSLGMNRAFVEPSQPGGADFSGMCSSQNALEQLFVSEVIHQAFINVSEKGTEAAAATAVIMEPEDSPMPEVRIINFTPTFRADRPFLFLIRDKRSGSILFLGRITKP